MGLDEEKCAKCGRTLPNSDVWQLDLCGPCHLFLRQQEYIRAKRLLDVAERVGMKEWNDIVKRK